MILRFIFIVSILIFSPLVSMAQNQPGFAVIELFTSEGCSSCPPADAFLIKLKNQAENQHQPIYVLSFHVDYWDYLGWKDPSAQHQFSLRQQMYGDKLKTEIYTPQMVINGLYTFVGGNQRLAYKYIEQALAQKQSCQIKFKSQSPTVTIETKNITQGNVLNVAEIQDKLISIVLRGENAGEQLEHTHVVRSFKTIDLINDNSVNYTPLDKNLSLIAYVQNPSTGEIFCAEELKK